MKEKTSLTKIYSKKGDDGYTITLSGKRVWKGSIEIEIIGLIDELMVQIEKIMSVLYKEFVAGMKEGDSLEEFDILKNIRSILWVTAAEISNPDKDFSLQEEFLIDSNKIKMLEDYIDSCKISLKEFVIFKDLLAIEINEARVRTRSIERTLCYKENVRKEVTIFINRLSDFFFALAYVIERNDM